MSHSPHPLPPLPDLLDRMTDLLADVLDAAGRDGWSPLGVMSALDAVDLLIAAAAQYGGPLAAALEPVPGCTVAARSAVRDPLPDPPWPRTAGARREVEDGTDQFRTWRDARRHTPQGQPPAMLVLRAAYERAAAAEKHAKRKAREAAAETLRALDAMQTHGTRPVA
ncbi:MULTISPECIES: hypothetical protein [unclassified Streptomyces]|uniref:hypothetical protein n=1 Tax=unclassified Streptomyces TaxID=2593676 RepID=UPI00081B703F|nr:MULTISPECIES: hypothetical protein [unclassified Streptomyces]MYQ86484.1 hypothetical protein [Streptomyces sp. SID4936]SCE24906.1 hypothetical protein GA0115234_106955 [Streptomyces sp. DvalAA-43]